jgi:hypothetical protein
VKRSSSQDGLEDDISSATASRSTANFPKRCCRSVPETLSNDEEDLDAQIVHKNQPLLMTLKEIDTQLFYDYFIRVLMDHMFSEDIVKKHGTRKSVHF